MTVEENGKPQRGYVRVPEECRLALETMAARHDVPLRSLTRLALSLGLEMLRVDERIVKDVLSRLRADAPRPRTPQAAASPR